MTPHHHHHHKTPDHPPYKWPIHKKVQWEANKQGIRGASWRCLSDLISRENSEPPTSWNPKKWNSQGSSAYGLPQALPGEKMASEGGDWSWNPRTQVRWMIKYSYGRYGSVCNANYYQLSNGYY